MNKNYKSCDRGHFYPATHSSCPHCQNQSEPTNDSNRSSGMGTGDTEKTALMGNPGLSGGQQKFSPGEMGSVPFGETVKVGTPFGSVPDDGRTVVVPTGGNKENPWDKAKSSPSRKLVGWLVSYTINELGVDFRLYEGQNNIGREAKNTVRITEDPSISSHHATILNRGGMFYLRDEMSTNPSFVNGEEVMPGNTVKLKDVDSIMLGKTVLMLRVSILNNPNQS